MVILKRLEKFANDYFSHLQFGFKNGTGCIEASFLINEAISYFVERSSKVFACFLDVRKAFDTVWIDGLFFKLFTNCLGREIRQREGAEGVADITVMSSDFSQNDGTLRILTHFRPKIIVNY